jgi:hypothetical protein
VPPRDRDDDLRFRQIWEAVGDCPGDRIRRRWLFGWQRFRLESGDGAEIGRVKANFNAGTKSVTVFSRSYRVSRVGVARHSDSLSDESGRFVARWHHGSRKDGAISAKGGEPRFAWEGSGFTLANGEDLAFCLAAGGSHALKSATVRLVDAQGKVAVTMRWLPRWPIPAYTSPVWGMPLGEAVFGRPVEPDLVAVTALAFENFEIAFQISTSA